MIRCVTPRNLYRYKLGKIIKTGICIGIKKIIMIEIFIGIRYENNNDN